MQPDIFKPQSNIREYCIAAQLTVLDAQLDTIKDKKIHEGILGEGGNHTI